MFEHPDFDDHEMVAWFQDPGSGLRGVIALHSTALGPAMGGCRLWSYASDADALGDALRLSRGMSLKNAMAELPLGGGKSVIIGPVAGPCRAAAFEAFGAAVDRLGGAYVTAEDVGVGVADMQAVARATRHVSGLAGTETAPGGDPSPFTARGVLRGMQAAAEVAFGSPDLRGRRVAVQGVGHVGAALCGLLADAGATLVLADADAARARQVAARTGAEVADPGAILAVPADIVSPCALGGTLSAPVAEVLQAPVVAGAANNQLATPDIAPRLAARGILYAPDYVINAGGIIAVGAEYLGGETRADVLAKVDAIGPRLAGLFAEAAARGESPALSADRAAATRLAAAR